MWRSKEARKPDGVPSASSGYVRAGRRPNYEWTHTVCDEAYLLNHYTNANQEEARENERESKASVRARKVPCGPVHQNEGIRSK